MNKTLKLDDGRTIDYFDSELKSEYVVVAHHGTPGFGDPSHKEREAAERAGVRLLALSRPGYHGSSRQRGRSVSSIATDVEMVLDRLGIESFATYGVSGGGPHALACAALLPSRVKGAASVSGVAPYLAPDLEFLDGMGADNIEEFQAAVLGEPELTTYLEAAQHQLKDLTLQSLLDGLESLLSKVDVEAVTVLGEEIVENFRGALSSGIEGWIDDDLAFVKSWGFDVEEIKVPIRIFQGEKDLMVPPSHGVWLKDHIPGAQFAYFVEEGHISMTLNQSDNVIKWLLDQLKASKVG